jgi:putative ABC transport system substrate-binding protein
MDGKSTFHQALRSKRRLRRREFISLFGAVVASPHLVHVQRRPVPIGFLGSGSARSSGIIVDALKLGLRDNGLIENRDYVLTVRWAEGVYDRFPLFADEIVQQNPAVILATTNAAVRAAQLADATIPVIMTTINDPVGNRLVVSALRPGSNVTGVGMPRDLTPRLVEMLLAVLPRAAVIGAVFNADNPSAARILEDTRARAYTFGATIRLVELKNMGRLETAFGAIGSEPPDALLMIPDAAVFDLRQELATLALERRLPAACPFPEFIDVGFLIGYGARWLDLHRRAADYVKRVIEGTKAADLAIELPRQIELSINLQTAKTLGIPVSDSVLALADKVIG